MLRFVVGPNRMLVPDLAARLPGRGIWLSARRDVIETARTRGSFVRAARGPVNLPPDLLSVIEAGLVRRVGDLLGFARRAGQAVCGFERAREWLVSGRARLVVQAADGSREERARFLGRNASRDGGELHVVAPLPAAELGAVFGRDHVVHVAVARGRLADAIVVETMRLAGVSGQDGQSGRAIERNGA